MARFNYGGLSLRVDRILKRFGRVEDTTFLRRNGVDRAVEAIEADFKPQERDGVIVQQTDLRFLLSAINLSPDPDEKLDRLVLIDGATETEYIIVTPPQRTSPGGTNIFWQLHVRER